MEDAVDERTEDVMMRILTLKKSTSYIPNHHREISSPPRVICVAPEEYGQYAQHYGTAAPKHSTHPAQK